MKIPRLQLILFAFCISQPVAAQEDYRYRIEVLATGLVQPMMMQELPDRRILFIEIAGRVRLLDPASGGITEAGSIPVTNTQENGLLGLALDPEFSRNGWIYLLHSPTDFNGQIVSRFTLENGVLALSSRSDLISWEEQREQCCHHAGSLRFGPDGCLYIATGDNTNPFNESNGYAPIDERPGRGAWDAQKSSSNTNDLRGKILRIKPDPSGGYTIPDGNLFPKGTPGTRPEIYAMGFRNPWRFSIDPASGFLFVGDVGPDAGGDHPDRGPRGHDVLYQIRKPGNFGWPYQRAGKSYRDFDFVTRVPGPFFDPLRPVNDSPNNTGRRDLPPVENPLIAYAAGASAAHPVLGQGGRTACGGPVFHYSPSFESSGGLPAELDGLALFYDWERPFMHWARISPSGELVEIVPFSKSVRVAQGPDDGSGRFQIRRPVDAFFSTEGSLYILDYGEKWGVNDDSRLVRISYQRGNLAPVAKANVSPSSGPLPLTVNLSASGSFDHEGDPLQYRWEIGGKLISETPAASTVIDRPGTFAISLEVDDGKGGTHRQELSVTAGNTRPAVNFLNPSNGDFFTPGESIPYRLAVTDREDLDHTGGKSTVRLLWRETPFSETSPDPGLTRLQQAGCFNCHGVDTRVVGPSFQQIADRYHGHFDAAGQLAGKVISGSSGNWGSAFMVPHPHLTEDEVQFMTRWILALSDPAGSRNLLEGTAGTIVVPAATNAAILRLEAEHRDQPKGDAPSLAGSKTIELRHRKIQAEHADDLNGPKRQGDWIGNISHGQSIRFKDVPFDQVSTLTMRAASGGAGGIIEARIGSPDGQLLGTVSIPPTGTWEKWSDFTLPLQPSTRRADLCLVFSNPGKSGLMNLDWVEFKP